MDDDTQHHSVDSHTDTATTIHSSRPRSNTHNSSTNLEKEKLETIRAACEAGCRGALVELAVSTNGLISDEVRREAWPLLLGFKVETTPQKNTDDVRTVPERMPWEDLPPHEDEGQVKLDVDRSFIYYPTNMSPRQLDERKKELSELIVGVLRRHPKLGYFQGFHDICQVILLVLGPKLAVPAVEHIALLRIRDFMLPSMSPAVDHLRLLYPLLNAADPKLCAHLSRTQPFFALAATLTLYAHDIQEYSNIARLFDVFLAMDPVFPLYLFAQIVMERKEELFEYSDDEPEILHSILSKLPKPLDLEGWISRAIRLLEERPPENLSTWSRVSCLSVLKTSRHRTLSLAAAEGVFQKQCNELWRAQKREELFKTMARHKKPIVLGLSVFIGVSSIALGVYAQRNGGLLQAFPGFMTLWRAVAYIRRLL